MKIATWNPRQRACLHISLANALLIRNLDLRVVEFRVPLQEGDPRGGVRAEVQVAECRDLITWPGVDVNGPTMLVPNI